MGLAFTAEPAVIAVIDDWRAWLAHERRISGHTLDGYGRDLRKFLQFITGHLGYPPGLQDLEALKPRDFRGYLASRHAEGLARSSTARAMSTLRNFFRFMEQRDVVEKCRHRRHQDAEGAALRAQGLDHGGRAYNRHNGRRSFR